MLRGLIREPLVQFLLAGLALYGLAEWHARETDPRRIVITGAKLEQLRQAYAAEFGSPPPPAMEPRLIEDHAASEVLFREAMARGLDKDDEIVRRRLIQKMQFLVADMALPPDPSERELRAWYASNRARYAEGGTISFSHLFFAADASNEASAKARALAVLPRLSSHIPPIMELGDSFPDQSGFGRFSPADAMRLFGETELTAKLFSSPVGQWRGPWRSSWGWHLVRVSGAQPGSMKSFEAAREGVKADWLAAAREKANAKRMAEMRARYTVVRE
jgi:peptidyl-prolyl cis-trans isomerase C